MKLEIRPMTRAEQKYSYTQSQQIAGQTGCIGHLRADMDTGGNGFFSSWDNHRGDLKTQEFKDEFDAVINALRFDEQYHVEWCACFVSWCANECGYIENGIIPMFAWCPSGTAWFQERALWQDGSYEPRPGDIIFFDWDDPDTDGQDGSSDHVGIVERVENGYVYTVEGNSSDSCRQKSYSIGYYEILGYGTPVY